MILSALLFKAILVAVLSFLDNWHADACSVPKIREKEGNEIKIIEVTSGEDVKLTCQIRTVGQTSKPRYYWLKDNQTLSPSSHHRMRLKLYRYLKIKRAKKEDAGFYTCVAVNDCGENSFTMHLFVGTVKPHFLYPDKMAKDTAKLDYTEGDKFQLQCDAKGTPTPTVTWYRGKEIYRGSRSDETITPGRYHYTIYFNGVDVKDAGNYTCVVKNSYGTLTHSYVFEVKVREDKAKLTELQKTESTTDGSTVNLTSISSESEAVTQTSMGWTDRIRYPAAVIAVSVGVVVMLIIASGLCYWQVKKGQASSSATMKSRHNIDSLQAKHVVQSNEYVIVPDLKGLGNDFGTK